MPKVYSRHDAVIPPGAVRIGRGRGEVFGNPYVRSAIYHHKATDRRHGLIEVPDAAAAVAGYETLCLHNRALRARIRAELAGKDLVCCGQPPCHAYTLLRIANSPEEP